jgi:hypothetical protein
MLWSDPDALLQEFHEWLLICIAFACGAIIYSQMFIRSKFKLSIVRAWSKEQSNVISRFKQTLDRGNKQETAQLRIRIWWLAIVTLGITIGGHGLDNLIERDEYMPEKNYALAVLSITLSPIVVLLLGYVAAKSKKRGPQIIAYGFLFLFELLFFAQSSRRFAFAPVMFAFGYVTGRPLSMWAKIMLVTVVISSSFLVLIPIHMRKQSSQGIAPLVEWVLSGDYDFLDDSTEEMGKALSNIFAILPMNHASSVYPIITFSDLMTSISPLPSPLTNWAQVSTKLHIYPWAPYNAPGTLLNYNIIAALSYYILIGAFFCHYDYFVRKNLLDRRLLSASIVIGFTFLFALISVQYGLRSVTRLVYYTLLANLGLHLYYKYGRRFMKKSRVMQRQPNNATFPKDQNERRREVLRKRT